MGMTCRLQCLSLTPRPRPSTTAQSAVASPPTPARQARSRSNVSVISQGRPSQKQLEMTETSMTHHQLLLPLHGLKGWCGQRIPPAKSAHSKVQPNALCAMAAMYSQCTSRVAWSQELRSQHALDGLSR